MQADKRPAEPFRNPPSLLVTYFTYHLLNSRGSSSLSICLLQPSHYGAYPELSIKAELPTLWRSKLNQHALLSIQSPSLGLYSVTAFILLDSTGSCILSKYYEPLHPAALPSEAKSSATSGSSIVPAPTTQQSTGGSLQGFANPFKTPKEQRAFEKGLWEKTRKANGK